MTASDPGGTPALPHDPQRCYGSRLHCWWHGLDEPDAGAFRACLECGHVYLTEGDLLHAWRAAWPQASERGLRTVAAAACAYCGHDW